MKGKATKVLLLMLGSIISILILAAALAAIQLWPSAKRLVINIYAAEQQIMIRYVETVRAGYTHLYAVRIIAGYGAALYGAYCAFRFVFASLYRRMRGIYVVAKVQSTKYYTEISLVIRAMLVTIFTLVLLESGLRLAHIHETYSESIGHGYSSYFGQHNSNIYGTYAGDDTFTMDHKDFRYLYKTNELGLRERPTRFFCDSPGYKIITLGDSYAEGMGTSYDSAWPRVLGRLTHAQVYNAGQSGHDPFFSYRLYGDKLSSCKPDLVILAINTSDVTDYFYRGGMSRYDQAGQTITRPGPWYERLYEHSYIVRMICIDILRQLPQMFATEGQYVQRISGLVPEVLPLLRQMQSHGKLLVVLHPGPSECILYEDHARDIRYNTLTTLIDSLHDDSIAAIDLYPRLSAIINDSNCMDYTFSHDKHYNGKGYDLFAKELYNEAENRYPGFWSKASR